MDAPTRRLLLLVQFSFGAFPMLGKLAMEPGAFAPRAVLAWRLGIGSLVLMAFAVWRHGRVALPGPRDLVALAGLSVIGITVNQLLYLEGLSRSTAVNAGLLITVIPVATLLIAALAGHERLTTRRVLGIGLAVAGIGWMFLRNGARVGSADTRLGDLLMIGNAVAYSGYLVLAKPVLRRLPQPVVLAWVFAFGALGLPWITRGVELGPAGADVLNWWALLGVVLGPTLFSYLGNIVVLSRTHASTTAAYVMLQPLIAAVLGIVVLGERPDPALLVTAVCVLGGLWLVSTTGRRAAPASAAS